MSATLAKAVLSISVDLVHELATPSLSEQRALQANTDRLLQTFARHELPVTWVVADPGRSPAVTLVMSRGDRHEIALWGAASWCGSDAGRTAFDRELGRRLTAAGGIGLRLSTLVIGTTDLGEKYDVAIRRGIAAVRHIAPQAASRSQSRMQPSMLRSGMWSFPVRCALPGKSRLLPGGGGGATVRRLVDRAIVERGLVPLAIDVRDLSARGYAAQRVLDRVLRHAERRRRQGVLDIATIGTVAAGLRTRCESIPSRSILRPAA